MGHGSRRRHNLTMPRGKAILCVFAQTHLTLHKIENLVSLSVELKTAYARMFSHDAPFRVHEKRSWFFHPSILGTPFARIACAQKPIAAPHEAKPPDPKASIFTPDSSIFRFLVRSVVETGPHVRMLARTTVSGSGAHDETGQARQSPDRPEPAALLPVEAS